MMSVAGELRKCFLRKYVFASLFALLLINAFIIIAGYFRGSIWISDGITRQSVTRKEWNYYSGMMKKTEGKITEGKAEIIMREYSQHQTNDYRYSIIETCFYDPYKYISSYASDNRKVLSRGHENRYIQKHYCNRYLNCFFDTTGWKKLIGHDYSDVFILALIFLVVMPCYSVERSNGMSEVILSSYKRMSCYYVQKHNAALIASIILSMLFSVENYLLYYFLYGLFHAECPIYSLPEYRYCPLDVSLFGFYLVISLYKMFGFLCFTEVLVFLSRHIRNTYALAAAFILFAVLMIFLRGYWASINENYLVFAIISPLTGLISPDIYTKYKMVYVAGTNIPLMVCYCVFQILVLFVEYLSCFVEERRLCYHGKY